MLARELSVAAGLKALSARHSRALIVPFFQHAAITFAVVGCVCRDEREASGYAFLLHIFNQSDQLHPAKLVIAALIQIALGNEAA